VTGSFAFFCMLFLLFLKVFPVIAIAEVKEIAIHEKEHEGKEAWSHAHTYGELH
jgi:hypothetical protein